MLRSQDGARGAAVARVCDRETLYDDIRVAALTLQRNRGHFDSKAVRGKHAVVGEKPEWTLWALAGLLVLVMLLPAVKRRDIAGNQGLNAVVENPNECRLPTRSARIHSLAGQDDGRRTTQTNNGMGGEVRADAAFA